MAHLNLKDLRGLKISVPETEVQSRTAPTFETIDSQIACLFKKNAVLRQTRDLLLPKLISGEIDVDALDLPEAS